MSHNPFNPTNLKVGDRVYLESDVQTITHISGTHSNKVSTDRPDSYPLYAQCFHPHNPQPTPKIEIEYYTRNNYGVRHEYIIDPHQRKIIQQLTGRKTLNPITRELLRDLTNSIISFTEVTLPY